MEESGALVHIHPDILFNIFHKLPVRSVCQCKLVCKEWQSLISNPYFKSNYSPSSIPNHPLNLIMIPNRYQPNVRTHAITYEIEVSTDPVLVGRPRPQPLPCNLSSQDRIEILGAWNGLVGLYRYPGDFILFNPCSKGKEIVVHVPIDDVDGSLSWLIWHVYLYGLCHDSANDEYKAVFCDIIQSPRFHVASFKYGTWSYKTQPQLHTNLCYRANRTGTIVDGVPYWICKIGLDTLILYFDSKTDEFKEVPPLQGAKEICGLGALEGQLAAAVETNAGSLEIWGIKEHGNGDYCSWSSLFVIKFNKISPKMIISWMIKDVEVLIDVNGSELMIYNIEYGSLRQLQKRMKRSKYNVVAYIPSFISPN